MAINDNNHPIIRDIAKRIAGANHEDYDPQNLIDEFVQLGPDVRAEALLKAEEWVSDESATLRQRAQLVNMTRKWREIDRAARKVNR